MHFFLCHLILVLKIKWHICRIDWCQINIVVFLCMCWGSPAGGGDCRSYYYYCSLKVTKPDVPGQDERLTNMASILLITLAKSSADDVTHLCDSWPLSGGSATPNRCDYYSRYDYSKTSCHNRLNTVVDDQMAPHQL